MLFCYGDLIELMKNNAGSEGLILLINKKKLQLEEEGQMMYINIDKYIQWSRTPEYISP